MGFKLGIVGLPNVGKSTLFNSLSRAKAEVSNYPFCTINPNIGVVEVPDPRLPAIAKIMGSPKTIPTVIEFVDIAGLVRGAHKGEGLGNQFLSHIREVDAIAHVVRCFTAPEIVHVEGDVNPKRDMETINYELILADLAQIDKKIDTLKKAAKTGEKQLLNELELFTRLRGEMDAGKPARLIKISHEEEYYLNDSALLTRKPVLYVANVDENHIKDSPYVKALEDVAAAEGAKTAVISSKIEAEIKDLSEEEAREFMKELGIAESGLIQLIRTGYSLLDLVTFFTANSNDARAWTVKRGTKAPQAAGKVHTDFEKGFIKAEVINAPKLIEAGTYHHAKEKGIVRMEGKEYHVADGDLIQIHFNR